MQRLRKDRTFILAEVKGLVLKSATARSVDYMNAPRKHVACGLIVAVNVFAYVFEKRKLSRNFAYLR